MSQQAIVGANPTKNNGGTIMHGGNIGHSLLIDHSLMESAIFDGYGSKPFLAVSPASSGNIGTTKALSAGTFNYQQVAGEYIGKVIGTKVNGSTNNILLSGAGDWGIRRPIPFLESNRRINITAWNAVTGAATKGANAGDIMSFGTDHAARPTDAIPGELVYMVTGKIPTMDDYKPRYNP